MKGLNKTTCLSVMMALCSMFMMSCSDSDDDNPTVETPDGDEFVLVGSVTDPAASYLLATGNLTTGSASAIGKGAELATASRLFKDGNYYVATGGKLSKYDYENNLLVLEKEIPLTGNSLYSYWIDDKTLIVWNGVASAPSSDLTYSIVNVDAMTITKTGSISLTGLASADKAIYMSSCVLRGGKLYVAYAVYNSGWTSKSSSYLAAIDYPAMTNVSISTDTRSAYAGSFSSVIPSTAIVNNDIYMITNTGDRWAVTPDKPSAIYKIKNGENVFATDYFFDLSAISDGNREFYGMWDLGNGKAITRMGKKELLLTFEDYLNTDVFEYYVLDLVNKTKTKLALHLDKIVHSSPVFVENGKAYIAISSGTEGHFVWTYDIASGSLTKGLEVKGVDNVNWISRFDD
jgi:hypothetical protein